MLLRSLSLLTVLLSAVIGTYAVTVLPIRRWASCHVSSEAVLKRRGAWILLAVFCVAYVLFVWQNEEDPADKFIEQYLEVVAAPELIVSTVVSNSG